METAQAKPRSFRIICDAAEGECEHHGRRYLEPIEYEAIEPGNPFGGYKVPDHERSRWDAAPLRPTPKQQPQEEARDIEELILELNGATYVDAPLEALLRTIHALEPLRVTRLAVATLEAVARGSLTNPGGFLRSRLLEIQHGKTKAL